MEKNEKYLHGRLDLKLNRLPIELLRQISSHLLPCDLIKFGKICKLFSEVAQTDSLWRRLVQNNVPGVELDSSFPCDSFKELYKAHDPHWFLPRNKLWFADIRSFGQLVIAKYHPETGCIGLHRLVAEKKAPQSFAWPDNDRVVVHCFEPRVYLHPFCRRLDLDTYSHRSLSDMGEVERRLQGEVPMTLTGDATRARTSKFMLAKSLEVETSSSGPLSDKWPPPEVPAKSRVDRPTVSDQCSTARWCRPEDRSQINEESFRIRQWMEMNGQVRMGDEVQTWSTLDFKLYTPTEDKPYRGIFVGDYSAHGAEFLLVDQGDELPRCEESNILERKEDEPLGAWEARKKHARMYQGSLRAIKLTGDPNVHRGEITWIADDISDNGLIGYGEKIWPGARIVKSFGQIANMGFKNPEMIETKLIMISHDELAHYWEPFGHISLFRRVYIDDLIKPEIGESTMESL